MAFSVRDFHDLVRLLREHAPAYLARLILDPELMELLDSEQARAALSTSAGAGTCARG
ncbi:hypothetical protein H5T56_01560 [Candidatus Bipolaricaulota bacterium]|nr:hypothetical protein [Candidatus Bipolaricaulota bacterium]